MELERSVRMMERNVMAMEAGNHEADDSEAKQKWEQADTEDFDTDDSDTDNTDGTDDSDNDDYDTDDSDAEYSEAKHKWDRLENKPFFVNSEILGMQFWRKKHENYDKFEIATKQNK